MKASILYTALKTANVPVEGVSIGIADDMSTWTVTPASPEALYVIASKTLEQWQRESDMADLRVQRNAKLSACDWTHTTDVQLTAEEKTAWATYRQALRDLPATVDDPVNPVWPTPPV